MLTEEQVKKYTDRIPEDSHGEDRRAAYSVISGVRDQKSAEQIASYYSVDINLVTKWLNYFNFGQKSNLNRRTRARKSSSLNDFIKSNIGSVVTPKEVASEVGISLPTFYNFYNANRSCFKKVKRGEFQIIDPTEVDSNK